jgi:glycosyltransferase involved in cell wall biosynthesis
MGIKDPLQGRAARHFPAGAPPGNTIVVAAFGGITPEKRLGPLIRAISAMADRHPQLHLMLVGGHAEHYDVVAEARRWGIADRLRMTGYVPDSDLADHLLAADICACLRWPTNRETSASWLRCLAAGRATIITDLAHLGDVPSLDPRGWRVLAPVASASAREDAGELRRDLAERPVCVSIDILDEEHSLQLALERLVTDIELRHTLGRAAREWWATHHQLKTMADAYDRVLREAAHTDPPPVALPRHLVTDGSTRAESIIAEFDVGDRLQDVLGSSST